MHTYSYTKILKFYKFRTFGVFYENLQYILLLKNFNIKIQYQKLKEYIRSSRLPNMTSNRNGLLIMAYFRGHSWSFVVTRGHSWSLVVIRGHSWSFVCTFRQDLYTVPDSRSHDIEFGQFAVIFTLTTFSS